MDAHITLRIFDIDALRMAKAEHRLHKYLHRHHVLAQVETIACQLEMGRQGLTGQEPVLQVNGLNLSTGVPLTDAMLDDCCQKLAQWQRAKLQSH